MSTFAAIIGELKERLHKWTQDGQYGYVFDNVADTLSFKTFQTFNFKGFASTPDVLEPLLFYILHRASNEIVNPERLATFKTFLLDEAWLFIKNATIRNYVVEAQKTWRKHNAAMILATQSIKELEESGMLEIVSESCPTKIFLANPDMNRELYREKFHLNDTELGIISGLLPPGQMLIRKAQTSKKVQLNVDSVSYWMATNNAKDNLLKREYFERYGIPEGLRRLARDYPFSPHRTSEHAGCGRRSHHRAAARRNSHHAPNSIRRYTNTDRSRPMKFLPLAAAAAVALSALTSQAQQATRIAPNHAQEIVAIKGNAGEAQQSARTVHYHAQDIVGIKAKLRYTTLIEVPATEKIMEAATGDKDFWIVDVVGNFCFVHPAKAGINSNLNLITDHGNIYSFTLTDVTAGGGGPGLEGDRDTG